MPTVRTLSGEARIVALRSGQTPGPRHAHEKIIIEDGWVFREHHGKYVECICRSDEILPLVTHEETTASLR
jgi:hypothetical protein